MHPYTDTTHTFSPHSEKIFNVRSGLIISPQALRHRIPSHHTGANNFPISFFTFLSTVLRSFTRSHASRKRDTCYNKLMLWFLYKSDSLFPTIDDLQARDRNSFIRIPQMRIHQPDGKGKKKDQFKLSSRMLFQRHPLLL